MRNELLNRWGLLLAAVAAGVAWAIGVPLPAAAIIGVVVWLARAGLAAVPTKAVPANAVETKPDTPRIRSGSDEAGWVARAERAVAGFADAATGVPDGPIADEVARMRTSMTGVLDYLRRLAEQATRTGDALGRINEAGLAAERKRLEQARRTASPDVAGDIDRALTAVNAQLEVRARLVVAKDKAMTRLGSTTLGLEAMTARVAELAAMPGPDLDDSAAELDRLAGDLDTARAALAEAEQVTRRLLDN
jgi:hypothetical protein